jgi:hypothetical protein
VNAHITDAANRFIFRYQDGTTLRQRSTRHSVWQPDLFPLACQEPLVGREVVRERLHVQPCRNVDALRRSDGGGFVRRVMA